MFSFPKVSAVLAVAFLASPALVQPVLADVLDFEILARGGNRPVKETDTGSTDTGTYQSWMSADIKWAWDQGGYGQGVTITVVDDFKSVWGYYGSLDDKGPTEIHRHGEWTLMEASMIAPQAKMVADNWNGKDSAVKLTGGALNVINLSYGMIDGDGLDPNRIRWKNQEQSIIDYATNGDAVIAKAAGNDYGTAVGEANADGIVDYLNVALIGAPTAIFVGALSSNNLDRASSDGSLVITGAAEMADYSNIACAGTTTTCAAASQFLVVGVDPINVTVGGTTTGLYGTSFAAPIVAGYAAIVGSKWADENPTAQQVADQLLLTAIKTDGAFVNNYNPNIHGQGIACISCAVSPDGIE